MTDAQFLSINSITCEANHVKFETRRVVWRIKAPNIVKIGLGVRPCSAALY